jgi:uncharacterized RDD family membrane protein YckC
MATSAHAIAVDETRRFSRTLVTPEGVDLGIRIATASERAGAFIIDAVIMMVLMVVFSFIVGAAAERSFDSLEFVVIVWLVGFFLVRNFYFLFFELGSRAATPGKRLLKIRVASRNGGVLRADAIFARNAMREVEVFLPLSFLASNGSSVDGLIALAGFIWTLVFVFFPLFNRDRLRAGDVAAGTWVVQMPRRLLLKDLAAQAPDDARKATNFNDEQLSVYGIKELHVLEDVLRASVPAAISLVADRIRTKIGWRQNETDEAFLRSYYAALRKRLESELLMGIRRADKHDRERK